MRSFIYRSSVKIACECGGRVILCVADNLMLDGSNYLNSTLTNIVKSADCNGCDLFNYYLDYDETLLLDPNYIINSFDVTGVFCYGCLMGYIEYDIVHLVTTDPTILAFLTALIENVTGWSDAPLP